MHDGYAVLVLIVIFALVFDFINGFHDTANAIATVVSTRVLTPRAAIVMSATLNFVGALVSTRVAKTIADDIVRSADVTQSVIMAAIIGAIVWNLVTWRFGIPSSSSHALIGGLVGAAFAFGGGNMVKWHGLLGKVVVPLLASPLIGFVLGFAIMAAIYLLFGKVNPRKVGSLFRALQLASSAAMAYAHGTGDAQKSMGIITLALVSFHVTASSDVPTWVKIACAVAMGLGTSAGGWRIIKTMGHKIIRLDPVQGFAAETSASIVILAASLINGLPVSTTHVISGSIFGVGSSKRLSAVRWGVARSMVAAWVLTIPAAAVVAAISYELLKVAGMR